MKIHGPIATAVVGLIAFAGFANAAPRSIETDMWNDVTSGTGSSLTFSVADFNALYGSYAGDLPSSIQSLTFSSGTPSTNYDVQATGGLLNFEWQDSTGDENVIFEQSGNGSFTVSFLYDSYAENLANPTPNYACAGAASISVTLVNGSKSSYGSANPCAAGIANLYVNTPYYESTFSFSDTTGALVSTPPCSSGGATCWLGTAAAAAPEIDANSAASSVTLLLGGLVVLARRRL